MRFDVEAPLNRRVGIIVLLKRAAGRTDWQTPRIDSQWIGIISSIWACNERDFAARGSIGPPSTPDASILISPTSTGVRSKSDRMVGG